MAYRSQLTAPDPQDTAFLKDYLASGLHCWHVGALWGQGTADEWKGLCVARAK